MPRLVVSHTFLYKKLDEYGKDHNEVILKNIKAEGERLGKENVASNNVSSNASDKGRKIVFDNFDFKQNVHHMSETHQNLDKHWVSHMSTENRVSGNHLDMAKPPHKRLLEVDNGKFVPNKLDQQIQRENYGELVSRIIVDKIVCLHFLKTCIEKHIKHQYSTEMMQPTSTVSSVIPKI